ncbi:MAG: LysE family translocator [Sneathiella sp.]
MSVETILALIGFAFVMSISPGPGNFLLLTSGVNFGYRRSLPLVLGINIGFLSMVFFVGLGLGKILQEVPLLYTILKFASAAYILWLAWKISTSRSLSQTDNEQMGKPLSFLQAAFLQLLNPKAWAVALILSVSYTNPEQYLFSLLLMIGIFALINLPTISVWALSGVALRHLLGNGKRIAVFNIAMALLLVASMLPVLLQPI